MEEKNNNKTLYLGVIIFLIICLILIIYFTFKIIYKDNNSENTNILDPVQVDSMEKFTELKKYIIEDGETKEIIVDDKTISVKREKDKTYINNKEVSGNILYITNLLIFVAVPGQYGEIYDIYDLSLNKIDVLKNDDCFVQYNNFRLENNLLLVDNIDNFDSLSEKVCEFGTYEIKYSEGKIKYEKISLS